MMGSELTTGEPVAKPARLGERGAKVEDDIRANRPNLYKSFLLTRLLVGVVGVLLPTVIIMWDLVGDRLAQRPPRLLGSLSAYYHDPSPLADWFVGSLWAIGVGLLVYMGTRKSNFSNGISIVAGGAALIVSLFPTNDGATTVPGWVSDLHFLAAGALIVGLGVLCWGFSVYDRVRADGDESADGFKKKLGTKKGRRWIHRVAAITILAAVLLVLAITLVPPLRIGFLGSHGVLIAEVIAVYAFAVSWATKGAELWEYSRKHPAGPEGAPLAPGLSQPGTAVPSPAAHS